MLPPGSRDEAVQQARRALRVGLGRKGGLSGPRGESVKERISQGNKRLRLDFPLQSESADSVAKLAQELAGEVASDQTVFCFGSAPAAERARQTLGLPNCYQADEPIPKQVKGASLVMIGVSEAQAALLLGSRWSAAILINPKGFSDKR